MQSHDLTGWKQAYQLVKVNETKHRGERLSIVL